MELNLVTRLGAHESHQGAPSIHVPEHGWWTVSGPYSVVDPSHTPQYACISYVWGPDTTRIPHPYLPGRLISKNTISALAAAISISVGEITAFWIDVFCIPYDTPSRQATLESMGYIYATAVKVIAVLGHERYEAFTKIREHVESNGKVTKLDSQLLAAFENDPWIQSVWTYQEVVNASQFCFTTQRLSEIEMFEANVAVEMSDFLNVVGDMVDLWVKQAGRDTFVLRTVMPFLDAFIDLAGDWKIAAYTFRSAFQIMSHLDRRVSTRFQNYYYSMIGSLTQAVSQRPTGETVEALVEQTMQVCEAKGDYSYIFSRSPRDESGLRSWRPSATHHLHSVLPYPSHGTGQRGLYDEAEGFWLFNIMYFESNQVHTAKEQSYNWLEVLHSRKVLRQIPNERPHAVLKHIPNLLERIGFEGSRSGIVLDKGCFYPVEQLKPAHNYELIISTEVWWTFGAPGLARWIENGKYTYVTGLFVGLIDRSEIIACLL